MVHFCPRCHNLLKLEQTSVLRMYCSTCPYIYQISSKITQVLPMKIKQVDDVFGGDSAWANVEQTRATCGKCSNVGAYYMQMQIRSADEPMTTFYKCANKTCGYQWRED